MLKKKYFYPAAAVLVVLGCILRFQDLFIAFQYDELWTLQFYANGAVGKIFRDLATPNNHPLNSLLMKWSLFFSGGAPSTFFFRLPAFIAGIGCMVLMIPLAMFFTRSRTGTLAALFLLAVNPWAILYSAQARGYSLQLFLLMLLGLCAVRLYQRAKNPLLWSMGGGVAAILAVLTISSSILFILPVFGILFLKRRDICGWVLYGISGIFCVCWYLVNFAQFRAGQQFGVDLNTVESLVEHFCKTPWSLCGAALLFALVPLKKRDSWGLYLCFAFPFLAAFASKAGGTRVYLPCIIPCFLLAGMGITGLFQKFHRKALTALFLLLAAGAWHGQTEYEKIRLIDWWELFAMHKNIPQNTVIVYPGNYTYPAQMNNPGIGEDFVNRLIAPEKLLMFIDGNGINGVSGNWGEYCIKAKQGEVADFGICRGYLYRLTEKSPAPGELVLIIDENKKLVSLPGNTVFLNIHFRLPQEKRNTRCVVFRFEKEFNIPDGVRTFVIAE